MLFNHLLDVDEAHYTFSASIVYVSPRLISFKKTKHLTYLPPSCQQTVICRSQVLNWEDDRTASIIMDNVNYSSCSIFCSSIPDTFRNAENQPACCDGIFIPSVTDPRLKLHPDFIPDLPAHRQQTSSDLCGICRH